jgi:hypothetical protein
MYDMIYSTVVAIIGAIAVIKVASILLLYYDDLSIGEKAIIWICITLICAVII